ncbi:MAG TPA: hypothetical protein EYP59_09110 [Thiotrichaceae bacterium]|nr:hypothetical protein [Thiotrichaceae bacterium]
MTSPDMKWVDDYKHIREVGRNLNSEIITQLSKSDITECGKKLGIVKNKTLQLSNEEELSVLFDYCLYSYRQGGKNPIERYIENTPPSENSDDLRLLQAMSQSYYSMFTIEEVYPEQGATIRDRLRNNQLFLMDIGIGKGGMPGMLFAGRVLPFADFYMSSGAIIPLQDKGLIEEIMLIVKKFMKHKKQEGNLLFSPAHEAAFSAQIIRAVLRTWAFEKANA